MQAIKIIVTETRAEVIQKPTLTSGIVGLNVEFTFDESWTGLTKTAVFRCGKTSLPILCLEDCAKIPGEILKTPGSTLYVGVYGTDGQGNILPTVWANVGMVQPGTTLPDTTPEEPTPDIYGQILSVAQKAEQIAVSLREDADRGAFNGADGIPGADGNNGLPGDTPRVDMLYDKNTGNILYGVTYTTDNNEPETGAVEVWDNTKAKGLPEGIPPILVDGTGEYEGMLVYSVKDELQGSGMTRKLINLKIKRNLGKAIIRLKIKYVNVSFPSGTLVRPTLFISDEWISPNVFGADYTITDEVGNPVGHSFDGLDLGRWYTVYITANGDADFQMWPVWNDIDDLRIEAVIKDIELLHHETMPAYIKSNSGNCAPMSLYKTSNGAWEYAYSSYYEGGSTANTAYYRRVSMLLDAADYSEVRFDFMYTKSDYQSQTNCNFAADVPITVVDGEGNTVVASKRQLNTWYTAICKKADGSNLPKKFDMYPQGYTDGTVSGMLNIEMQIKNCRAYKKLFTMG